MPPMASIWLDGTLVDERTASVRFDDHGLVVGDGVFETMMIIDGTPFAMGRHLARLHRSAAGLGLSIGWTDEALRNAATELIAANDARRRRCRLTVTGGSNSLGSGRDDTSTSTVILALGPLNKPAPSASVMTVPWSRNPNSATAGLKTTSYAENVIALAAAHARGGDEAIFADTAGNLSEGTGSNIFLVRDGQLLTPALSTGCLAGVTRALVLELTGAIETELPLAALASAPEAFLTSTTRLVQPIASVDDVALGTAPGPVTAAAAAAFATLISGDLDP